MKIDERHAPFFIRLKELGVDIEEFINNCDDIAYTLDLIETRSLYVVDLSFIWEETPSGQVYWSRVNRAIIEEGY